MITCHKTWECEIETSCILCSHKVLANAIKNCSWILPGSCIVCVEMPLKSVSVSRQGKAGQGVNQFVTLKLNLYWNCIVKWQGLPGLVYIWYESMDVTWKPACGFNALNRVKTKFCIVIELLGDIAEPRPGLADESMSVTLKPACGLNTLTFKKLNDIQSFLQGQDEQFTRANVYYAVWMCWFGGVT